MNSTGRDWDWDSIGRKSKSWDYQEIMGHPAVSTPPAQPTPLDLSDDDLYKIGYWDGRVRKPMDPRHELDAGYIQGYEDGKEENV